MIRENEEKRLAKMLLDPSVDLWIALCILNMDYIRSNVEFDQPDSEPIGSGYERVLLDRQKHLSRLLIDKDEIEIEFTVPFKGFAEDCKPMLVTGQMVKTTPGSGGETLHVLRYSVPVYISSGVTIMGTMTFTMEKKLGIGQIWKL
jgi:hypothetical protein